MPAAPTFDAVFAVMRAAAAGDHEARVPLSAQPDMEDAVTQLAITLNLLLDDLAFRSKERARFEERLRQSQKMEAIGNLAGGIAHDFNNMLSVILGYTDLARNALPTDDPIRLDLEEVLTAAERARKLTSQLLSFSRKQVLKPQLLDLNVVLGGMRSMLARLLGEQVELNLVQSEPLGVVKVDQGQIEQVVLNLAVNARDSMPSGGKLTMETANVLLDANYAAANPGVVAGPYVLLAVADTGVGMERDVLERIFEPFFTTKKEGRGTGFGLTTVFGIVQQSGGHINVYSEPGRGTTFKTYFPRSSELPEPRPATPVPTATGGVETILLVEDLDSVRALSRTILARRGYRVLEASCGEEALRVAREHPGVIHLLLTDVVMPRMTGPELAVALLGVRPDVKVLFMSGYTDGAIVDPGLLPAGSEFLQKPLAPDVLLDRVRKLLGVTPQAP
jgi:two-component system cell cycle sensor histidine kinase/response regulator CckA